MASLSDALSRLGAILDSAARIAVAERARMHVESKPDDSLVTNADKAVERYLRGELPALAQKSTIWGEEEGYEPEGPGGLWLVDPIDGTSNYRFGQPLWGISVGLYRNGVLEIGGIALPDLGETYLAELGKGASLNGKELARLAPGPIQSSQLVSVETDLLKLHGDKIPGKARISGAFVIAGCWVASGRFSGLLAEGESLYDVAASVVINRELGADVRYANGAPFDESALVKPVPLTPPWVIFPPQSGFYL